MACVGLLCTPRCTDFHGLIAVSLGSEVSMGQWLQRLWESHSPHPEHIVVLSLQSVFLASRGRTWLTPEEPHHGLQLTVCVLSV